MAFAVWLMAEIGLTWVGYDDLADFGEYIFKAEEVAVVIPELSQELSTGSLFIAKI